MKTRSFEAELRGPSKRLSAEEAVGPITVSELRIKTIVLAVDFSEGSRKALEYAVALAKSLEAEIVLVHVFEGVPGELKILEASFVDSSFQEEARASLTVWQQNLGSTGVKIRPVFRKGPSIGKEILEAAKECNADLIVIGRHEGGSFFLRNTVRKVLTRATCPVLVGP